MPLPAQPVTFSVQQIKDLSQHFSSFRHDANNSVGLISAAAELMRYSPGAVKKWSGTLIEQPSRIAGKTREFIAETERTMGVRANDEPSWYRDLWTRSNAPSADPAQPSQVPAEAIKAMHHELLQFHKELTNLGFMVAGVDALASQGAALTSEAASAAAEQLNKVSRKFDQFAVAFEKSFGIESLPHRLLTGVPSDAITLTADEVALFHRRLTNLERDIHEHIAPLLELSQCARRTPEQLQGRAAELAPNAPKIAALVQKFGTEFDKTFGLHRGT